MLDIKENIFLREFNTFKIGGKARYFVRVSTIDECRKAVKWAKEKKTPFFILGGGSNILFSDKGYDGLIIKIENQEVNFRGENVIAGAGVLFLKLILLCKEKSLGGLEWGAGIPGTVGGAIFGNAGAFGGDIKDNLKEVIVLDTESAKEKRLKNKECQFFYRNSIFKREKKYIIFSGVFALKKTEKKKIEKEIKEHIFYRKEHHPLEKPSAGSIFKNVKTKKLQPKLMEKFPEFKDAKEIPAAYLVAKANLKGKQIGGAKISEKHTNFIVNEKNAKAKDVIFLIEFVKKTIKEKFNIALQEEVIIIK